MNSKLIAAVSVVALAISCAATARELSPRGDPALVSALTETPGLVALWDFKEGAGSARKSGGRGACPLTEKGRVPRVKGGPLSGYAADFGAGPYLSLANERTGALNIHGARKGVTVMGWVKWKGGTGFVGGMWNEGESKRQYGLFVHLPYYNGGNRVCGHVSKSGGRTPPFPYSIDYSASSQPVPLNTWTCVAFTYDGRNAKSYLAGKFQPRNYELIRNTVGFPGYPSGLIASKNPWYFPNGLGDNGADFTVGAVQLKRGMGNKFQGAIGGLAVFDRVLKDQEITRLCY
jgi:hypothetical protein